MARLMQTTPLAGLMPLSVGAFEAQEVVIDRAWLVAPFKGQQGAVDKALKRAIGVGLPDVNTDRQGDRGRALWVGPGQALVFGDVGDLSGAAVTDQSDAYAVALLTGAAVETVLARLVPLDLRVSAFPVGRTARSLLGHMPASITRTAHGIEVMVMRSMAGTLVHDLTRAASGVAAGDRPF